MKKEADCITKEEKGTKCKWTNAFDGRCLA